MNTGGKSNLKSPLQLHYLEFIAIENVHVLLLKSFHSLNHTTPRVPFLFFIFLWFY